MKYLKKTVLFLFVLFALVIFFLPKVQLYYAAENLLAQKKITLSKEIANDRGFVFSIEGGTLYFEDLEVAQLDGISVMPLLIFNRISFAPFSFSQEMQSFIPGTIEQMNIQYTIIDPLHVIINIEGDFGTLNGSITFLDQHILADMVPSDMLLKKKPVWLKQFKKQEGGVYRYESNY